MIVRSWLAHGNHHGAAHTRSPTLAGGAEAHVLRSPTGGRGSWSAGTCAPCRGGRACAADVPATGSPSNVHCPVFGSSKPVSRLKNVVLPAPFGPIRAVISLRCTSTWSTSTATSPPNARRTESTTRIGSDLATPGCASGTAFGAVGDERQRTSKTCSRRSPKMPCGRNTTRTASDHAGDDELDLAEVVGRRPASREACRCASPG